MLMLMVTSSIYIFVSYKFALKLCEYQNNIKKAHWRFSNLLLAFECSSRICIHALYKYCHLYLFVIYLRWFYKKKTKCIFISELIKWNITNVHILKNINWKYVWLFMKTICIHPEKNEIPFNENIIYRIFVK